jgi:7,8-dihydroneopterin aldolase/epimerase/oxygenase
MFNFSTCCKARHQDTRAVEVHSEELSPACHISSYALRLRGIRVRGHFGVTDTERACPQDLLVDVDVEIEDASYPQDDDLDQAVDYAEIARVAARAAQGAADHLLESYVVRVARCLADHWPVVHKVRVACTKAHVPTTPCMDSALVEVTLRREAS